MSAFRSRALTPFVVSLIAAGGCVQQAYDRTVVFEVDVSAVPEVRTVGVRGDDAPLKWNSDQAMRPSDRGGVYTTAVTYRTGAIATEIKFTVNGDFELSDQPNRVVRLSRTTTGGDTTIYRAVFGRAEEVR